MKRRRRRRLARSLLCYEKRRFLSRENPEPRGDEVWGLRLCGQGKTAGEELTQRSRAALLWSEGGLNTGMGT